MGLICLTCVFAAEMFTQTTLKGLVWNYTWTAEHDGKNREEICRPFIKDGVFSPHRSSRIVTFILLPIIYCFTKSLIIRNNHFSASSFPWHYDTRHQNGTQIQLHLSLCDPRCSPFALHPNSYILLVPACLLHWESHFYWFAFPGII